MEMTATKTCRKCGEVKHVDEFNKRAASKDGLQPKCRECSRVEIKEWHRANPERSKAGSKAWREANPERMRELRRGWYEKNKEKARADARAWHSANYERSRAASRSWKKANAEHIRQYDADNYERRKPYMREWRKANADKHRAKEHRRRARKASAVPQRWLLSECDALACYYCGRGLLGAMPEIDHVMPISMGGPADPSNEVMSCQSCNRRKSAKHPLVWIAELVDG